MNLYRQEFLSKVLYHGFLEDILAIPVTLKSTSEAATFLKEHFPMSVYEQQVKEGTNEELAFHFLISLQRPLKEILGWLEVCNTKHNEYLNTQDTITCITYRSCLLRNREVQVLAPTAFTLGLTPLSCAVLMERIDVVKAFCRSSHIIPGLEDKKGWVPLQHAIGTRNADILAVIEKATSDFEFDPKEGRSDTSQKEQRISPQNRFPFLRKIAKGPILEEQTPATDIQKVSGEVVTWNEKDFYEQTGFLFIQRLWASSNALFLNWLDLRTENAYFFKSADCIPENPPENTWLLLRETEDRGKLRGPEWLSSVEVIAKTKIPKGTVLYTFVPTEEQNKKLKSVVCDSEGSSTKILNYALLIKDGVPNTFKVPLEKKDGVSIWGIIALENLEQKTPIFF